ncbi:MAG: hypothetical protein Q4F95_09350 [Oscillospiraceae bacterium]|nr:hypothetical protein [Oscillospiraceae bacterium]
MAAEEELRDFTHEQFIWFMQGSSIDQLESVMPWCTKIPEYCRNQRNK